MSHRHALCSVTLLLMLAARCAKDDETTGLTVGGGIDAVTPADITALDVVAFADTTEFADTAESDDATPLVPDSANEPTDTTWADDTQPGEVGPTDDASAPAPTLAGPCPPQDRIGGFTVESQDEYSIVDGKVLTGVVPVSIPEPVDTDLGPDCALTKRRILYCDPGCGPNETCGLDETCIPYPSSQDVGTVSITGLEGGTVTLTPKKPGNNYFDTDVPHPVFVAGAVVALTSSNAAATLTLWGIGVHDLPIEPIQWNLVEGDPLTLSWVVPPEGAHVSGSTMEVRMSVDQHGSSPATLTCTFDDTGSAQIPDAAIDALLAAGISGFPNGRMRRMTADHQDADGGCVDFVVTSTREALVRVAGVTPCKSTADCPSGQACNTALELCE